MLRETLPDELRHFKEENKVVLELSDLDVTLSYFYPQGRTTLLELKKKKYGGPKHVGFPDHCSLGFSSRGHCTLRRSSREI